MIAISNDLFADLIALLEDRFERIEDGDAYNDDDVIRIHDRLLRQKAMQSPQKEITMIDPLKKYQTTAGVPVEIRYADSERGFLCELSPVPGSCDLGYGAPFWVNHEGRLPGRDAVFLVERPRPREKRVVYVNIYHNQIATHPSLDAAIRLVQKHCIARKRIEIDYAVGEFDE